MADVGDDRQPNRIFIQRFGGRGTPDASAVLLAGMLGNDLFPSRGTMGEHLAHARLEPLDVFPVQFCAVFGFALAASGAEVFVRETFLLGALQRGLFDQNPLPLVAFAGAAPFQDDGRESGIFARPSCQRRVA